MSVAVLPPSGIGPESTAESELIRRAQAGDRDAFGHLYRYHHGVVLRFLRSQLPNSLVDVEDVAAEAFITALTKIDRFSLDESGRFVNWLIGIARFGALHYRRHRATHPELELLEWSDMRLIDDRVVDAEQVVVDRIEVAAMLARLSADQRRALLLQHACDLTSVEVARRMGITPRALWQMTEMGRNGLREELRPSTRKPTRRPNLNPKRLTANLPAARCACGCGAELPAERHHSQRYATDACRAHVNADVRSQRNQRHAAGSAAEDPALGRVLAAIVAAGSSGMGRKELTRQTRLSAVRVDGIAALLVRRRLISVALEQTARRPVTRYRALAGAAAGRAA